MSASIHRFDETKSMTYADGFAFIERTRRQLDRYGLVGAMIAPEEEAKIRTMLDELEADLNRSLGT